MRGNLIRWLGAALTSVWISTAWSTGQYPSNPNLTSEAIYLTHKGVMRFDPQELKPVWTALADHPTDAPVVTDQAVLIGGSLGLYALSPQTGSLLWQLPSSARLFSPSVAEGIAYVGDEDGTLRALSVATGEILWRRNFTGWVYPPAIVDNQLVVGGQEHRLYGLDAATGKVLWETPLNQELVYRPIAVGDGAVVVTTFAGEILALSAEDGSQLWQAQDTVVNLSPMVTAGRLYFRTFGGHLKVRRQDSGALLWEVRLQGPVTPPVSVDGAHVIAADGAGNIVVLDAATGERLWQDAAQGRPIGSPIALDDKVVLFTIGAGIQAWPRPVVLMWKSRNPEEE